VLMIVLYAATWAVASSHGSYQTATKARTWLLVAIGAAALDGGGIAWINVLLGIGATL
jgi:fatty-acid desaturase